MIKHNEILFKCELNANRYKIIDLKCILPLGKIDYVGNIKVELSYDNKNYFNVDVKDSFNDETARYIKITSDVDQEVTIYMGLGYVAIKNTEFEQHFINRHGWTGADGIYSFNLEREEDYNQMKDKTLFVFGDTFCGQVNDEGNRIEPTAMVNNTLGYYHKGEVEFEIARNELGAYESLFEPNKEMSKVGYLAKNLTQYLGDIELKPFISEMDFDKDIEITFDIKGLHTINKIAIENYHDDPEYGVSTTKRGVKTIDLYTSLDGINYQIIRRLNLYDYSKERPLNVYKFTFDARYIKFVIPSNKHQEGRETIKDKIVGLKKVYFYQEKGLLHDVETTSNTEFFNKYANIWYWLQDGIIKDNTLHIYPGIIEEELNGIEGFEFKMNGVAHIKMNIVDGKVDYRNVKMREVPLYLLENDKEYMLPIAIHKEDEYCYFYGYYNERKKFLRHMIVARIKFDELEDLNNLEYYDGENWVNDMNKACSLLEHISCEMSVQKIVEGENKGKYLAVFQYDSTGDKVAYSIGETVHGPFTKPRVIYLTEEVSNYNVGTTYTYNAKAHLHLSRPKDILVSYNCNDMSMKQNKLDYSIYHPRFLNLKDTSND